ncbi:hypothetical protein EJB05_14792 [Eragrostis curvula]|uniref:Uncharacterized protein n=1 Tax=Eragrostis curvula TaxID=38414 RepID=A0A5J9VZD6_9POAL|nr:hypothetical protein EJB05_14792 [Eragrostis curvula]
MEAEEEAQLEPSAAAEERARAEREEDGDERRRVCVTLLREHPRAAKVAVTTAMPAMVCSAATAINKTTIVPFSIATTLPAFPAPPRFQSVPNLQQPSVRQGKEVAR